MEYERLTKRNANGEVETVKRPKSSYIQEVYEEWDEINRELKLRLAELEDKIEAGTLVTVPYAIGQEVYCVRKNEYFDVVINETEVLNDLLDWLDGNTVRNPKQAVEQYMQEKGYIINKEKR